MTVISKHELDAHLEATLAMVTEAEDVLVTDHGTPRWRISAVRESEDALDQLEREGRLTRASRQPTPWPEHPGGPRYSSEEVAALLDEVRGDH